MFKQPEFDFYDKTMLKSYNLNEKMRYQLQCLDSLDVFTRLHCENVAALTVRLCDYMKLNTAFTEYCTICAYLHDIGKLFIPSQVLQKPGKLTDQEFEIMKTHTTIGYKLCLQDPQLRPYKAGPIYHHEALNGSGYPRGIKGNEIPIEGQIIRVADEYDAITSKRQYKTHIGTVETLEIIVENTKPTKDKLGNNIFKTNVGKNNPTAVKALFKVVEDDTAYEIYNIDKYIKYLKNELPRFEQMEKWKKQMDKTNKKSTYDYYKAGIEGMLQYPETLDNFQEVHQNYLDSLEKNTARIKQLQSETKQIHKLSYSI